MIFRRLHRLQRENQLLREALRYYANRGIWRRAGVHPKGTPVKYSPAPIINDKGMRAREAFSEIDRMHRPSSIHRLLSALRQRKDPAHETYRATVPAPAISEE